MKIRAAGVGRQSLYEPPTFPLYPGTGDEPGHTTLGEVILWPLLGIPESADTQTTPPQAGHRGMKSGFRLPRFHMNFKFSYTSSLVVLLFTIMLMPETSSL
jgi:hypothetical protein